MTGKIKWFDNKKAYGFITGEDGNDYFLHIRNFIQYVAEPIAEGVEVVFDAEENTKGKLAKNVKLV